jgi:hypothetical protein
MTLERPNRPEPQPLKLGNRTTSIVVLDLSRRCENPQEVCSNLMIPSLNSSNERGKLRCRFFTLSPLPVRGHRLVKSPRRSSDENQSQSFIQTPSTNLWMALKAELDKRHCRSLIIVGSATNFAVLYTATTAARIFRYNVVIPLDGVNAKRNYEHEYAIHQMTILPASAHKQFRFTKLGMIAIQG